jgi:DNA (cytosine-5)-methyltransferase 1
MRQQPILPGDPGETLANYAPDRFSTRNQSVIISAGFPCQDASKGNPNGKGIEGSRTGTGWSETYRIIRAIRPEYVFLENVPNLLNRGWGTLIADLSKAGYFCWWRVIPAKNFGFPFEGERIYSVAMSSGCFGWPAFQLLIEYIEKAIQREQASNDFARIAGRSFWGISYPEFLRVDNGIPSGAYRLTALGNSCISIFPEMIIRGIVEFDK